MPRILRAEDIDRPRALKAAMRQMPGECAEPPESDLTARDEPISGYPGNDGKFAPDMPPVRVAMAATVATP